MANKKVMKIQKQYENLHEQCSEMSDYISSLSDDNQQNETESRYLREFIHYKKLDEEFRYFRENAHEEYEEDMPFSYLTL